MIDVLTRLAELDANNPNVKQVQNTKLSESVAVNECGEMMNMQSPSAPHTPASIHITAGSGEELSGMLQDIMQLAGIRQHADQPDEPQVMSATPVVSVSNPAADDMRAVIDKLNPEEPENTGDSEEETDDEQLEDYDNSPNDPSSAQAYDADAFAYHPNPPGAGNDRGVAANPRGVPTMEEIEQQLFSAYQQYLNEEN